MNITIVSCVKEESMTNELKKCLDGINVNIMVGQNYPSFSKMMNELLFMASKNANHDANHVIIFCSHRVRPTKDDIIRLHGKVNEGYGLVMFSKLAFFGFKIELLKKVGIFDERYEPGGYEDDDYYTRLKESNIAIYQDSSVKYVPGLSLWQQDLFKYPNLEYKNPITLDFHKKKWHCDAKNGVIYRKLNEHTTIFDYGEKDDDIKFKKWKESILLDSFKINNFYQFHILNETVVSKKRILIFGGSGSLGNKLIELLQSDNEIYVFSRDENKHWQMKQKYNNKNNNNVNKQEYSKKINFIIGDIRDEDRVYDAISNVRPHIIIIASAMKHIDMCEFNVNESLLTNTNGVFNVCKSVEKLEKHYLNAIENVVFISSDKATSPTNVYGMTKSISERIIVEYSLKMAKTRVKFVNCRYGNILNSRGSIIPKLQESKDPVYYLTDVRMTRFIMSQREAIELIIFSIINGNSGETIVPQIHCINILDLFEIFSEKFNKKIITTNIRPGEKLHEELLNNEEINRSIKRGKYYVIQPSYFENPTPIKLKTNLNFGKNLSYCSDNKDNLLNKSQIKELLQKHNLY